MEDKRIVTDSEWKIMELLWKKERMTMAEITSALQEETRWSKHTVVSLLKRMCAKGSAEVVQGTSPMEYRALIPRKDAVLQETRSVLKKAFGGRSALLISELVDQDELSDEEIDELMRLLEAHRK